MVKDIHELSKAITKGVIKTGKTHKYSLASRQNVVDFMYEKNMNTSRLSSELYKETGLHLTQQTIARWKKDLGKQQTAFIWGEETRNDVRTQCLAVAEYKNTDLSYRKIAEKYHVSETTVRRWTRIYSDTYQDHIENLPDGVPYLMSEEKIVQGDANILAIREQLLKNKDAVKQLLNNMGLSKTKKDMLHNMSVDTDKELNELAELERLQNKFNV